MKDDNTSGNESVRIFSQSFQIQLTESSKKDEKPKKKYNFPSPYSFLLIMELFIFILTFIIPKGHFDTIEYSSEEKNFIIRKNDNNSTIITVNASQEELDKIGVNISLNNFLDYFKSKQIRIPNTYKKINYEYGNIFYIFFSLFNYPIKGLIESATIGFFLLITGGTLKVLEEIQSLSAFMICLKKKLKKKFLILILVLIIFAIAGTTFGILEQI